MPARVSVRRRVLSAGLIAYALAAAATLAAELGFVQLRFRILGKALPRAEDLDTAGEVALFLAALVAVHLALLWLALALLRRARQRRGGEALAAFDFLYWVLALEAMALAAKLILYRYFSEGIGVAEIRALAGGRLEDALVYAREEMLVPVALGVAAAVFPYLALRRLLSFAAERHEPAGPRVRALAWLAGAGAIALLLWAAAVPDARRALERFNLPWLAYAALGQATDFDRDGYSLFSTPPDPAPFDGVRHPYALDIPGNGIDEDGLAGDFRYPPPPAVPAPSFAGERRHVVLIVLESTRADAIGKMWGGRAVTPNLTALAAAGTKAPEAYSHYGVTALSLRAIFSGRVDPSPGGDSLFRDFHRAGYRVAVFSSESERFGGIAESAGMRASSDVFEDARTLSRGSPGAARSDILVRADGRELLRAMDRSFRTAADFARPAFLYFNVQEPHFPYAHAETPNILPGAAVPRSRIAPAERTWVRRTYWNAVAYSDWLVGQVVARLKRAGVYENSVVVVVGDHGEALFEQGYIGHGHMLDALQTQVPMLFSLAGVPVPRPAGLADLRALVLRAAGADVPAPPPGRPVFQYLGDFDQPSVIGMVESGGRRTFLELSSGRAGADGIGEGRYAELADGSPLKTKVERLANLWAQLRWEAHLARRR